jgi:gamma-glutamylcyclotransferase (GGCT)/AIG2-like uncharacterized protein YtfP
MNAIVIREVTERSLADFVRGELAGGATELSQIVSARTEISLGKLFLITTEALVAARVQHWNWSIDGLKEKVANSVLGHVIIGYLRSSGNRVLIQDFETRSSDPPFKSSDPPFKDDPLRAFYGEELFWELQNPDVTEEKIRACITGASYWPWLGYFCKKRAGTSRFLTDNDFEEVADQLVGVAVQTLHDSYVIWWRTDLEPFPVAQNDRWGGEGIFDEDATLFVYGSLIDEKRREEVIGRRVVNCSATLTDYELARARYFYIRARPGISTPGLILEKLTASDFEILDRYEEVPELYTREKIWVELADGQRIRCWVYMPVPAMLRGAQK